MLARPSRDPDWSDVHTGPVSASYMSAREAFDAGFANMPGWATHALSLRDKVVGRLGLTTVTEGETRMTSLPVLVDTPQVFETGLEDKHLTFTLETRLEGDSVSAKTRIWFNHWSGQLYLRAVLIPHRLIMRHIIRSLA